MGQNLSRVLVGFAIFILIGSALAVGPVNLTVNEKEANAQDVTLSQVPFLVTPSPEAAPPAPSPNVMVGGDFLISYDDGQNGRHPAFAITPMGTPKPAWDGTMHGVWDEQNESDPYSPHQYEIHYSQSAGQYGGRFWTNDKNPPGDRIISNTRKGYDNGTRAPTYNPGDKVEPAIAVDMYGYIHVVWRQMYSDGSWEILYSRSMDNGETWSGFDGHQEKLVSYRAGGGTSEKILTGPAIAVSNNRDTGQVTIHVVWAGFYPKAEGYEVLYSQSVDNGVTWSGAAADRPISTLGQRADAKSPTIATSYKFGDVVTVAWLQNDLDTGMDEIFSTYSRNFGGEWAPEQIISFKAKDYLDAQAPTMAGNIDFTAVSWSQPYKDGGTSEIMYSYTRDYGDSWLGWERDFRISRADGQNATDPSMGMAENGLVYVAWTETDQNAYESIEVHVSQTMDINTPTSWTGLKGDQVISNSDANIDKAPANAGNVSVAVGFIDGAYRARAIWDEVNWSTSAPYDRVVDDNWEIIINTMVDCSSPVVSGWNLVSVPTTQDYTDLDIIFNDAAGDGQTTWSRIMWYSPTDQVDHWKQYNTGWSSTMNDLSTIDLKKGVWIYITNVGDGYLTTTGRAATSTSITLYAGWNLVGYPAQDDSSYMVVDLKTDTGATIVEGFSSSATYKTKVLVSDVVLKKGSAYWVNVPSNVVWTINW